MAKEVLRYTAYVAVIAIAVGLGFQQWSAYRHAQRQQATAARVAQCTHAVSMVEGGHASDATEAMITSCLLTGHLTQIDLDAALARIRAR